MAELENKIKGASKLELEKSILKAAFSHLTHTITTGRRVVMPPPKHIKLVQHENVTIIPYLGASTMEAQEGVAIEIAEAVVGALRGDLAATAVNAPMVPAELSFPIVVLEHKYIKLICTGYLDSATEEAMEEFRRFEEVEEECKQQSNKSSAQLKYGVRKL
ncbi:hypothetical protein Tco_0240630 [Tanacetum coccineum]